MPIDLYQNTLPQIETEGKTTAEILAIIETELLNLDTIKFDDLFRSVPSEKEIINIELVTYLTQRGISPFFLNGERSLSAMLGGTFFCSREAFLTWKGKLIEKKQNNPTHCDDQQIISCPTTILELIEEVNLKESTKALKAPIAALSTLSIKVPDFTSDSEETTEKTDEREKITIQLTKRSRVHPSDFEEIPVLTAAKTLDLACEPAEARVSNPTLGRFDLVVEKLSDPAIARTSESAVDRASESAVDRASESATARASESAAGRTSESAAGRTLKSVIEKAPEPVRTPASKEISVKTAAAKPATVKQPKPHHPTCGNIFGLFKRLSCLKSKKSKKVTLQEQAPTRNLT